MSEGRILVVDDEPQITRILKRSLTAHRYEVRTAPDGETAIDTFNDFAPELIITDLQMPEMGGLVLCREIRKLSAVPIIVLSVRGEESTKVAALDAGADDYVTKPFGMEELMARIRAALRRSSSTTDGDQEQQPVRIDSGDFSVDLETYTVKVRQEAVHLTPKELELLVYFLRNEGKVMTHRNILSAVWGANSVEQNEYLRVFVGTLRKKLEPDPADPQYIVTEPWVGYRFNSRA
ncbi:MAG TPA: response regulator transcription factor [Pyrinomonadaceae bacterium]|nr:response regulator transcription factor [Pyrinomonadaceae bacterium]